MLTFIQTYLSAHAMVLAVAIFTLISSVLTAVSTALTSLGDKVPTYISTPLGWVASILNFLNGK